MAPLIVRDIFAISATLRAGGVTGLLVEQTVHAEFEVAHHHRVLETGDLVRQLATDPRVIETYLGAQATTTATASADRAG